MTSPAPSRMAPTVSVALGHASSSTPTATVSTATVSTASQARCPSGSGVPATSRSFTGAVISSPLGRSSWRAAVDLLTAAGSGRLLDHGPATGFHHHPRGVNNPRSALDLAAEAVHAA